MVSGRQFGREAAIRLVPPGLGPESEIAIQTTDGLGLRFAFEVRHTRDPEPSSAEITIYNLGRRLREQIAGVVKRNPISDQDLAFDVLVNGTLGTEYASRYAGAGAPALDPAPQVSMAHAVGGAYVYLEAGYRLGSRAFQIFEGTSSRAENNYDGTTWTTTISAGDGRASDFSVACRSFARGSTMFEVVEYLRRAAGLGVGNTTRDVVTRVGGARTYFPDGYVAFGRPLDRLSDLLGLLEVPWYIENGDLYLVDEVSATSDPTPLELSVGRGLLEAPRSIEDGAYELLMLLNPNVVLGRRVVLSSITAAGQFSVDAVTHSGDTHSGDFRTVAEARFIETIPGVF